LLSGWPPSAFDKTSEILERALRLIGPVPKKEESCREAIAFQIAFMKSSHSVPRGRPSRAMKMELDTLARAVRKAARLTDALSIQSVAFIFGSLKGGPGFHVSDARAGARSDICQTLKKFAALIEMKSASIYILKGAPRPDPIKMQAAGNAYQLLTRFGAGRPTLTVGGSFYELASVLYEAATGSADVDVERYCRTVSQISKRVRI
jgi:hypothetical protein